METRLLFTVNCGHLLRQFVQTRELGSQVGVVCLLDVVDQFGQRQGGDIDAMFYVAGIPVKLFKGDVSEEDGLALLPITNKSIVEFYTQTCNY